MKTVYSVLQFRKSLLKDEVFNIGIAFGFVHEKGNKVLFKCTDYMRLKDIYSGLNEQMLATYMNSIQKRIAESEFHLHEDAPLDKNFKLYLRKNILLEDSTALQFTTPKIITNIEDDNVITEKYSKELLSFYN